MVCNGRFDNYTLSVVNHDLRVDATLEPKHRAECFHAVYDLGVLLASLLLDAMRLVELRDEAHCINYLATHPLPSFCASGPP